MTIKQQILAFLRGNTNGLDDDELAGVLGVNRQQINNRCNQLAVAGLIIRKRVHGKLHNFPAESSLVTPDETTEPGLLTKSKFDIWHWEGNVQAVVVNYLTTHNHRILSEADTASHERGIDIVSEKEGVQMWVTVKGYPIGTAKTRPSLQASHWFKQAIFDILVYRQHGDDFSLAVALPDFPRYHKLAKKITWIKGDARFVYFWVKENGEVIEE